MIKRYCHLLFFSALLTAGTAFSADYYVSPSGSNGNPGTLALPWAGLQYGMDNLLPGDVLHVMTGIYHEKVQFNTGGTASNPITVTGIGYAPVLDGTGLAIQPAMIEISGHSYISVIGLEICNNVMNDAQGILVDGDCQNISLKNNRIHDIHFSPDPNDIADNTTNAQAIIVFGSDAVEPIRGLVISSNEVYNCRLGYSEGIAVNGNVDGFDVSSNFVHDLTNIGIVAIGHEQTCPDPALDQARNGTITGNRVSGCHSPYAYCAGVYIDGAKFVNVTGNSCSDNDYGIEIGCEHPGKSAESITVRNNIAYSNSSAGLAFGGYDYPAGSGKVINSTAYNNTLYKNDTTYQGDGELVLTYFENCMFENNLFFTNDQLRAVTIVDNIANLFFDYNLFYTPSGDQSELIATPTDLYTLAQFQVTGQETNGQFGDPLFLATILNDTFFSMENMGPSSPVVNNGDPSYTPLTFETDFFGHPRIYGEGVDIGAMERSFEGLSEQAFSAVQLFPNPSTGAFRIVSELAFTNYTITDLAGTIVARGTVENGEVRPVDFPAGVYIVHLTGKQQTAQARLVRM